MLLGYYESRGDTRDERVKDSLGTLGSSVLVGGLSTFLGVTPLIFSASEIFSTVCIAFLAMVGLGITHGLILLPVILSYIGTENSHHQERVSQIQNAGSTSDESPIPDLASSFESNSLGGMENATVRV